MQTSEKYTSLRQFYAWVGFIYIIVVTVVGIYLLVRYIDNANDPIVTAPDGTQVQITD